MLGIGSHHLDLEGFYKVLFGKSPISMEKGALKKVDESFSFLEKFSDL